MWYSPIYAEAMPQGKNREVAFHKKESAVRDLMSRF